MEEVSATPLINSGGEQEESGMETLLFREHHPALILYGMEVPVVRLELTTLAGPVFETGAYTVPPHRLL